LLKGTSKNLYFALMLRYFDFSTFSLNNELTVVLKVKNLA